MFVVDEQEEFTTPDLIHVDVRLNLVLIVPAMPCVTMLQITKKMASWTLSFFIVTSVTYCCYQFEFDSFILVKNIDDSLLITQVNRISILNDGFFFLVPKTAY